MTVSSIVPVNTYTGNSFCKKFDFDFLIESEDELLVQHIDKNGNISTLKAGIDYSIGEIGNKEGSYILFPLETSSFNVLNEEEKITLMLTLVIKQESEFRNSSYFNFNILEWTFDYIVRILQILNRKLERCVKVREGDNFSPDNLINDVKNSEINTKKYSDLAEKKAKEAQESEQIAKEWAIKLGDKVQKEDYSSKYYALDAKESATLAAAYVSLHYTPFCVNRGELENGSPVLLKLENNILKTVGTFDVTTAQGKFYPSLSDFSLDISEFSDGKYNIFLNPLEHIITLKNNSIYLGNKFPLKAVEGDYLFNISSLPYDLEEKTLDGNKKGIALVLIGTLIIEEGLKKLDLNPYNKNLEDFQTEQNILNNKILRMFDLVQKDHKLTFEEKEGLELLGEYVYKEATDGRYGYPDFYNKCLEEYKPYYENQQFYKNLVFTGNINSDNEDIKGFTLYSYIELKQIKEEINSFKIECDFILPDSLEKDTAVYGSKNDNGNTPKLLVKTNGKLIFEIPSESETKSFEEDYVLGSSYHSELSWEGTKANLVLQNETKKEQQISVSSLTWDDFLCFGRNYEAIFTNGSIKKESIKVYINGNLYAGAFTEKVNTKAKKLERVFEQPTLIENGEIGGINFAVQANKEYSNTSNAAFMAFNQDYKHYNNKFFAFSGNNGEYIIYNPNPLCINKLTIMNDSSQFILTYRLEVSDDGIVWWPLTEILTNDTLTADEFWDINLSSNKYHKYYKLIVISGIGNTAIREIIIKALEQYGPEITINPNGHMYYDIKDKEQIDKIYKHDGYAWYYGIDEENQRIFLPRNDFLYYTGNISSKCFMPNDKSKRQFIRINQDYTPKEDGFLYVYNFYLDGSSYEINGKEYAYQSGNGPSHYSGASQFRPVNKGETIKIKQADRAYFVPINGIKLNYTKQIYMVVGNTSVTKGKSEILQVTTSENDTLPLFTGMYYDFKPNHASWIKAGVTASGKVYESAYNELVKILKKEETKYGDDFKIVKEQEKDPDKDYSEYWIVNEDTQTFRTPLKISYLPINADTAPVMGNGMTLGFTNGAEEFSCYGALNGQNYGCLQFGDSQYLNTPAGQVVPETHFNNTNKITGLSTNSKYSGIIADLSGAKSKTAQLYFKVANAVENLELLNAGKVLECVNNCVTKNENKAYIIETYQNDLSGYNIYSNGYCEQWGVTSNNSGTITFLKKYKKKPNVITSPQIYTGAGNQVQDTQYDITLNGFSYVVSQGVVSWRAYGYLE